MSVVLIVKSFKRLNDLTNQQQISFDTTVIGTSHRPARERDTKKAYFIVLFFISRKNDTQLPADFINDFDCNQRIFKRINH